MSEHFIPFLIILYSIVLIGLSIKLYYRWHWWIDLLAMISGLAVGAFYLLVLCHCYPTNDLIGLSRAGWVLMLTTLTMSRINRLLSDRKNK